MPYIYTPLNYKLGQEICLLVVLPGEPFDPLRCDIVHVNLEDEPDYEAVSHPWTSDNGDASLSQSANCGSSADLFPAVTYSINAGSDGTVAL
jgi:hypothetical protein